MKTYDSLRLLLITAVLVLSYAVGQAVRGAVYGNRIDKAGSRVRWLTDVQADQGVEFEVPNQGTVKVFLIGEELYIHAAGDQTAGRSLVVRGVVVNQLRIGFEK